jgi:hypothetical protein
VVFSHVSYSQYVDKNTAMANNLTYASDTSFVLRADSTNVVPASGVGRQSVRIQTNAVYSTHVVVFVVTFIFTIH